MQICSLDSRHSRGISKRTHSFIHATQWAELIQVRRISNSKIFAMTEGIEQMKSADKWNVNEIVSLLFNYN